MTSVEYIKSRPLVEALFWFIENVTESDPERTELFFALRERVRAEGAIHGAMLAALKRLLAAPDLWLDELDEETLGAMEEATKAVDRAEGR